jgi:hypothetical protein
MRDGNLGSRIPVRLWIGGTDDGHNRDNQKCVSYVHLPEPRRTIVDQRWNAIIAAVAMSYSPVRALADASEITGLPRDTFEVHEISRAEFEALRGP